MSAGFRPITRRYKRGQSVVWTYADGGLAACGTAYGIGHVRSVRVTATGQQIVRVNNSDRRQVAVINDDRAILPVEEFKPWN